MPEIYPGERHIILTEGETIPEEKVDGCGASSAPYLYNGTVYQFALANITDNVSYGVRIWGGSWNGELAPWIYPSANFCAWFDSAWFSTRNIRSGMFGRIYCESLVPYSGPPDISRLDSYLLEEEVLFEWTTWEAYKQATTIVSHNGNDYEVIPIMTDDFGQLYFQNLGNNHVQVVKIVTRSQYSNIHTFSPVSFSQVSKAIAPAFIAACVPLLMVGAGGILQAMTAARRRRLKRRIVEDE